MSVENTAPIAANWKDENAPSIQIHNPGRMRESSSAYQRRKGGQVIQSPGGAAEPGNSLPSLRDLSRAIPIPSVETLGYFRLFLRDTIRSFPGQIPAALNLKVCSQSVVAGLRRLVILIIFAICGPVLYGADTWQAALARMPLHTEATELNRTNCVEILLGAFQSNEVVKALVFMPGATDELYLFRRARAVLTASDPSLHDAVAALTNQTFIHATFRTPFLLLHTDEDSIEPENTIQDQGAAEKLRWRIRIGRLNCNDWDWDRLQPILKRSLKIGLRPWRYSSNSWHFYRHSFAAWDVDGLQALELAALAGKSKFVVRRREAVFELDPRVRAAPKFDASLH